ncbi:hypothetical protein APHCRT_1648, partial [Anaplasma phagocytophilum str. CRT53-1]
MGNIVYTDAHSVYRELRVLYSRSVAKINGVSARQIL